MSSKHSIVILYTGKDCPDDVMEMLVGVLAAKGIAIPELVTIQYKDQDSLAALVLKAAIDTTNSVNFEEAQGKIDTSAELLKQAIGYIDGLYGDLLKGSRVDNLVLFGMKLRKDAEAAQMESSFNILNPSNEARSLWNAIRIIATEDGIIPPALAKKHHFNNTVVTIIRKVYNDLA